MNTLKKLILCFAGIGALLCSTAANAFGASDLFGSNDLFGPGPFDSPSGNSWVNADRTGSEARGYSYAVCYYQTSSYSNFPDHNFSIVIKGSEYNCPYSIKYNPVTGQWK
ncbi:hypothetical protein ACFBZI_02950 [Moraxella sp. ZJ142]|uniref:hypothetical protein n=1 Tax=Moraxella marmotae TaxID=3344520 RepID=UPI0035D524B3